MHTYHYGPNTTIILQGVFPRPDLISPPTTPSNSFGLCGYDIFSTINKSSPNSVAFQRAGPYIVIWLIQGEYKYVYCGFKDTWELL